MKTNTPPPTPAFGLPRIWHFFGETSLGQIVLERSKDSPAAATTDDDGDGDGHDVDDAEKSWQWQWRWRRR
jgi:hypothetical protein